jgi:hypothetical protein
VRISQRREESQIAPGDVDQVDNGRSAGRPEGVPDGQ